MMSIVLEVSTEKKDSVSGKDYNYSFNLFAREKGKLRFNTKGVFHTFYAITSERNICIMGHGDLT